MKKNRLISIILCIVLVVVLTSCSGKANDEIPVDKKADCGNIYIYGEAHGNEKILNKEFETWNSYYKVQGMRHLFVELPFYTGELLNIWMKADNDEILDEIYEDWEKTAIHKQCVRDFYKRIKAECPDTIFHATDVGHQHDTTGIRYLKYLEDKDFKDTDKYTLTLEAIEQGKKYYQKCDYKFRENAMVKNFIREFDELENEDIMGIYGSMHTNLEGGIGKNSEIPCMSNQLNKLYPGIISTTDLSIIAKDIEPERVDTIEINSNEYKALYFGKVDLTGFKDFSYREFWRLEDAYEDFKGLPKRDEVLPYNNYPMLVEKGQVFMVNYTMLDGSTMRKFYRSDGTIWNKLDCTDGVIVLD